MDNKKVNIILEKIKEPISNEIKNKIEFLSEKIIISFFKNCPKGRRNFFNINYFLNKIFLLLDMPEYAKQYKNLFSLDKQKYNDDLWGKISIELNLSYNINNKRKRSLNNEEDYKNLKRIKIIEY